MQNKSSRKAVTVARLLYFIVSLMTGVVLSYIANGNADYTWVGLITGALIGALFIYVEKLTKEFTVRGFSTATFGLCIGLFCAWLLRSVNLPQLFINALILQDNEISASVLDSITLGFNLILFSALGYLGTVLALRTNQDEFAFVIPFIRFRQENIKGRPIVCSMDILIDGRLIDLIKAGFINKHVILPHFIVDELQALSHSPSPTKKLQAQRGLDTLGKLRQTNGMNVTLYNFDTDLKDETHEHQTILTCQQTNSRLLTSDENLTQVAQLEDVTVLNLKSLSEAMKPQVEVGQSMELAIVRTGKEEHQGVGYLPDGTMIVVNNAVKLIGSNQHITVISTIHTSAGLMVFAELNAD